MPQLSVTVTADEAREIQERAGSETVSNYVRGCLGLPALARGRLGRQNGEVTRQASEERAAAGRLIARSQSETLLGRTKGVRATDGEGEPIDLHLGERIDAPFPPPFPDPDKLKMTIPYLNGDTQTQREDEATDTHELAYTEGDDVP